MYTYLDFHHRKVKIDLRRNTAKWINMEVSCGSVLGSILFNIFINYLCHRRIDSGICNFTDENTIFSCRVELQEIASNLESDLSRLFQCSQALKWLQTQ